MRSLITGTAILVCLAASGGEAQSFGDRLRQGAAAVRRIVKRSAPNNRYGPSPQKDWRSAEGRLFAFAVRLGKRSRRRSARLRNGREPGLRRAAHEGLLAPKRQSKGANIGGIQTAFCSAVGQQDARSGGAVQGDDAFTHIRFGAGYQPLVSSLGAHTSVRAELWGQYSPDRLPAVEQFDLGGNSDGREARSRTVPRPGAGPQGRPGVPVNRR